MPKTEPESRGVKGGSALTVDRRAFLSALASTGIAGGLFPGVLWAKAREAGEITPEVIAEAEKLAGVGFTPAEREMMLGRLSGYREAYDALRAVQIPFGMPPAMTFEATRPSVERSSGESFLRTSDPGTLPDPLAATELAFASVGQLGALLRAGSVTSVQITRLYLDRLRRFDPTLRCVVTLTEDRALRQAEQADRELASGRDRGPLHGIPWGAKDLLSVSGYPTSWGIEHFRERRIEEDATVVRRLDEAGAVLVAKLSLGELAMGDVWFGGRTRNPWNPEEGSSGSSAGSAAATAAGLVGFAIGSETLGSIVSPAARCGVTGLRPTFGRVSRTGAMPVAWSMDKIGPIGRSAEDCAIVLATIAGPDDLDPSVRAVPFRWDGTTGVRGLRVGYLASAFEGVGPEGALDRGALESLAGMDLDLRSVELPDELPVRALRLILDAEAAAAFDDLTREELDDTLVGQGAANWPNLLRSAQFISAREYIRANRIRRMVASAMQVAWADLDVIVAPSRHSELLLATNLTGHPAVAVPHGFSAEGRPGSLSFVSAPWSEAEALRLATAFQESTAHHLRRPPAFS